MKGKALQSTIGFISGVLIGLSIITPVLAASSPTMERWNGLLTVIALLFLLVGFGLYASRAERERKRAAVD